MATPINLNLSEDVNIISASLGSAPGNIRQLEETLEALVEAITVFKTLRFQSSENLNNFAEAIQLILGKHISLVDSYTIKDFVRIALGKGEILTESLQAISDSIVAQTMATLEAILSDSVSFSDNIQIFIKQLLIVAENINNYDERLEILLTKRMNLADSIPIPGDDIVTNRVFAQLSAIADSLSSFSDGITTSLKIYGHCTE